MYFKFKVLLMLACMLTLGMTPLHATAGECIGIPPNP